MLCNHLPLEAEGYDSQFFTGKIFNRNIWFLFTGSKTPFVLKLCFAGPPSSSVTNDSSGGRSRSGTYNGPAGPPRGSSRDDDRGGDRRSSGSRGGYRGRGEGRGRGRGRGR